MADAEGKSDAAKREEAILAFWNEKGIFDKTLKKEAPQGEFVFYDGPPFATGLPHYGHILAGTIKDVIPRYKTMQGYHVPRRWGWDCHGLPLENQIEKELGLKTKRDIEILGVGKFNEAARNAVFRYADDWKRIIPRFGRFVDMEHDYRTMDATYTESVWWAFKKLHDKGLVYEGFKPMHLCPRCGTTLSNFEVAQGYKDITDLSVTVKLELKDEPGTFLLAWTTTPWTLPGNMAAAVNAEATYVKIKLAATQERYILAKDRLGVLKELYTIEKEFPGSDLIGKRYEPPFPYFEHFKMEGKDKAWKVYAAPYVTMEDGTGLVHIAPAFGAEDLELAQKEGIPILHHVNKDGLFIEAVTDFHGMHAKPKDDPQSTDVAIIKYLAAKGLLFAKEKVTHSYPHCWRCETPLLNYATSSWFVEVTKFRDKLVSENKKVSWIPREVGEKRFGNWLENARDWAISRARYWGAPIPVWRNPKTKKYVVMGSLDDLKKYAKRSGNRYFVMRHGEAEYNKRRIINTSREDENHLTDAGKRQAQQSAEELRNANIDFIVCSPFLRTRETATEVVSVLGLDPECVLIDERLHEWDIKCNKMPFDEFAEAVPKGPGRFEDKPDRESYIDIKKRMGEVLYDLEKKHSGKNILIVSHDTPLMLLATAAQGLPREEVLRFDAKDTFLHYAEARELPFVPLPHNENYELDFHRPYIDELKLVQDGEHLERVPDVFDCWFESGSMSYAQNHYPFDHKDVFEPKPGLFGKKRGYPADFIAEGLDQTRGWFYSLLVLGVALFGKAPFKNVIVNGTVLAEDGAKMSKRLKNYPDPVEVLQKYGADAVRYYLLASPAMHGEDLNFSEKGVGEVASKLVGRLTNVLSFYDLYKKETPPGTFRGARSGPLGQVLHSAEGAGLRSSILDRWILARLDQTIADVTAGMETYELDRAARPLVSFVEDLSTWYLRRSRDRFKEEGEDAVAVLETTRSVLETFSKVAAPFIPFTAEYVYQRTKGAGAPESVHLCAWPQAKTPDTALITEMETARKLASLALEARQKANIKVRQPLAEFSAPGNLSEEFRTLIAEEINVKNVIVTPNVLELHLDINPTEELKKEGELRDLVREVQDLRKQAGLQPKEKAILVVPSEKSVLVDANWDELAAATNLLKKETGDSLHVRAS